MVERAGKSARKTKEKSIERKSTMKLTLKYLLDAKSYSLVAGAVALVTMAASQAAAERLTVFDRIVSGVLTANPEVISDNILSPEFTSGLIAQGSDLLENPSGSITQFGYLG